MNGGEEEGREDWEEKGRGRGGTLGAGGGEGADRGGRGRELPSAVYICDKFISAALMSCDKLTCALARDEKEEHYYN